MNAVLTSGPQRLRTPTGFMLVAILFYLVDGFVVRSSIFETNPSLLATVASIDLTFGLTAAWWMLVVRRGNAARRTILPVFVASVAGAALTLPPGHRDLLASFRILAIPFEFAVMAGVAIAVRRSTRALAAAGTELDVPERIRAALGDAVPRGVAAVIATELAMFYYALASWRRKPFVPSGATGFSYHRRNGYAGLLYTVVFLAMVELFVVDLLVRSHYPRVANSLLAVDLFGIIWLIGFTRALQLRPILVTDESLWVRVGLQWSLEIPRSNIETITGGSVKVPPRGTPGWLRGLPSPNTIVTLKSEQRAEGPYGIRKPIKYVALSLDDPKGFHDLVRSAR